MIWCYTWKRRNQLILELKYLNFVLNYRMQFLIIIIDILNEVPESAKIRSTFANEEKVLLYKIKNYKILETESFVKFFEKRFIIQEIKEDLKIIVPKINSFFFSKFSIKFLNETVQKIIKKILYRIIRKKFHMNKYINWRKYL